jgi:thiamine-phosphate pyrophosphorylase
MSRVNRLIDANANRAREALRVMEDAARFVLDDAKLTEAIKRLRHDLATALSAFGDVTLHRDTPGDVGTTVSTPAERSRESIAAVVTAAGKRLSEALRCCEEYGKTLDPAAAARIEAIRYQGYTIETQLNARFARPDPRSWRLCVLITESLCEHHGWFDVARYALDGGADGLQLREKDLDAGELLERASRLRNLVDEFNAALIVNDRPDVAMASNAHGVHLGVSDLPIATTRRLTGHGMLIGASTHNLAEAKRAIKAGADYCGIGAVFATTTKHRKPSGLQYIQRFIRDFPDQPHLAIGGINADNIADVAKAGAKAVAVSGCVCAAKRPATVVRKLQRALPRRTQA